MTPETRTGAGGNTANASASFEIALYGDAASGLVTVAGGTASGDLVWHQDVPFVIGNELNGSYPFIGAVHLVATYDRALTSSEVVASTGDSDE